MSAEEVVVEPTTVEPTVVEKSTEAPVPDAPAEEVKPEGEASTSAPAELPVESVLLKKVEEMTEDEVKEKILQQVEFYFSESNLPFDKFLFTLSYKDNPEHWVPVGTIASFKRMREFTAAKGTAYIADALKRSTVLELSESGEKVRRKVPLEKIENRSSHDAFARSTYAKGFGEETKGLQLELEEFFSQYGKWNVVRMRREKDMTRAFKGSVFVEWADMVTANKFLMVEPKPTWKGTELTTMSKKAYCDMKIAEKGIDVTKDPLKRGRGASVSAFEGEEGGERQKRDFNGWKALQKQKIADRQKADAERPDVYIDVEGEKIKLTRDGKVLPAALEGNYKKNALVAFEGFGSSVPWNDIKDPLKETWNRIYVEYRPGVKAGFVLLKHGAEKDEEQPPLKPLTDEEVELVKEKVKTIGGVEVTWRRATEAEEKAYWLNRANFVASRAFKGSRQHDRGGRGGRQNGRGGGRDHGDRGKGKGSPVKGEARARPEAVPVIQSTRTVPAVKSEAAVPAEKMDVDEAAVNNKRKREADGEADGSETKKAKVEETAAA